MLNIAIVTGGPSAERGISLKSAGLIEKYLDPDKYLYRTIILEEAGWIEKKSGQAVDMNDFSLSIGGNKIRFDFAFFIIHGTPAEDGKIQGYFEFLGIPHSTCHTLSAALTFNKQKCKDFLKAYDIPMAPSVLIRSTSQSDLDLARSVGFPVFVKPNNNGSSYGISKVSEPAELEAALDKAFEYDHEVIVEAFLDGPEYSSGIVKEGNNLHAFPITEIIPEGEFFDYEAKYEGASQEITPANLSAEEAEKCKVLSKKLYEILDCRGMVRFDYIRVGGKFYLLEANTIPGLSEASIIPQQALAYGWSITKLLDIVISDCMAGA